MAGAFSQPGLLVRLSEMSDRNPTCQPGRVTPHPDVYPGPTTWQTSFSGRSTVPLSRHIVNKFLRPAVLQLNIKGSTASKVNVLYHLSVQYEALVILLQETHCTCADKLTISGFALTRSSLSREHGLVTFVHDWLKWILVDQSPAAWETKWLCVNVDGCRIVNIYKLNLRNCKRLISQCSLTPFSMLEILIVHMSTGAIKPAVWMESALLLEEALTALILSTNQRM